MELPGQRIKIACWAMAGVSALIYVALTIAPTTSDFIPIPPDDWVCWILLLGSLLPCLPFLVLIVYYNLRSHDGAPPARPVLTSIAFSGMVTLVVTLGVPAWLLSRGLYNPLIAFVVPVVTVPIMAGSCGIAWLVGPMRMRTVAGVCCLVLFVVLFAWTTYIETAVVRSQMISTMSNGRSFFLALQAKHLELEAMGLPTSAFPRTGQFRSSTEYFRYAAMACPTNAFPRTGQFRTSTEYFRYAMTNGWMEGFDFSFFTAPGLDFPGSTNAVDFTSNHNAWCVTLDNSDDLPSSTALFFTRNLMFTGTTLNTYAGLDKRAKPYGDRGAVIVTKGGSARIVQKHESEIAEQSFLALTNAFLRP